MAPVRKVYQGISPEGRMTVAGKLLRQAMDLGDEPDISLVHAACTRLLESLIRRT